VSVKPKRNQVVWAYSEKKQQTRSLPATVRASSIAVRLAKSAKISASLIFGLLSKKSTSTVWHITSPRTVLVANAFARKYSRPIARQFHENVGYNA